MKLLNSKVVHNSFGTGIVIAQNDKSIKVRFATKECKFVYPNAFESFIRCDDSDVQNAILHELDMLRAEAKKLVEKESHVKEKSIDEVVLRKRSQNGDRKKVDQQQERIPGNRMIFYVFQGSTYDRESRGGYIWAPVSNKMGNTFHHWDRLLHVREGDLILHGYQGYVQAVSVARTSCYSCEQPDELRTEDLWYKEGRMVDCDYTFIRYPIKTADFKNDILRFCNVKYSPFNKNGDGNMGYLYEINSELARIFLQASMKNNSFLKEVDYVREFIEGIASNRYDR